MIMPRLQNKTAIITAAGQGIGKATAELFSREGAEVIATDINEAVLDNLASCRTRRMDVTDKAAIENLVAVDSSSWIHLLRPEGDSAVRFRVESALQSGEACWCPLIQLELWNGAGGNQEKKVLRDFARVLPELPITDGVWQLACDLARQARARGTTIPAGDPVIAACARYHKAGLETADSD